MCQCLITHSVKFVFTLTLGCRRLNRLSLIWLGNLKGRDSFEDVRISGRIIVKGNLSNRTVCSVLIWFSLVDSIGLLNKVLNF